MSLKLGTQDIAGISQNKICNAHFLLEAIWSDHIINDISFLRADTFSWQSGDVYVTAYNHLVQDIQGITAETETIGSYTVTFYRGTDGHKICLADQETTIANIYSETGIAWYYILDTTNTQFKLPRTKYGFEGLRTNVGDKIDAGLPNITGGFGTYGGNINSSSGAFERTSSVGNVGAYTSGSMPPGVTFDASRSSSIYGNSTTVQEQATQMYLYFYVGDYSQTAIEQTAGLNSELFNGKADRALNNVPASKGILTERYINGTSWYRVYSDGWCEQGGISNNTVNTGIQVNLLKPYVNTNYSVFVSPINGDAYGTYAYGTAYRTVSNFNIYSNNTTTSSSRPAMWQASGYIS